MSVILALISCRFALLNAMKDQQQSIEEVKNSNVAEHLNRMLRVKIGDTCADQVRAVCFLVTQLFFSLERLLLDN